MTFTEAVSTCFAKYVVWRGRAGRAEYWWWILFTIAGSVLASIVDGALFPELRVIEVHDYGVSASVDSGPFAGIFGLVTFLPGLSVFIRRLHDGDRSGWWFWLILIPVVGWIILLIWMIQEGTRGDNRFGPPAAAAR